MVVCMLANGFSAGVMLGSMVGRTPPSLGRMGVRQMSCPGGWEARGGSGSCVGFPAQQMESRVLSWVASLCAAGTVIGSASWGGGERRRVAGLVVMGGLLGVRSGSSTRVYGRVGSSVGVGAR